MPEGDLEDPNRKLVLEESPKDSPDQEYSSIAPEILVVGNSDDECAWSARNTTEAENIDETTSIMRLWNLH